MKYLPGFLFILTILLQDQVFGQPAAIPLSRPENRVILEGYRSKAESNVANNLNRFGLESMQRYDAALDSLYKIEVDDSLLLIEKDFSLKSSDKKQKLDFQQKQIQALSASKTVLQARYSNLLRKALWAFGFWLLVILFLLQFRKRKLKLAQSKLDTAMTQLNAMKLRAEKGKKLFAKLLQLKPAFQKLNTDVHNLQTGLQAVHDGLASGHAKAGEVLTVVRKGAELSGSSVKELQLCDALLDQEKDPGTATQSININVLCEQYLEIAQRGFLSDDPSFVCNVTRDLEKNLPTIKLVSSTAGSLMLNMLHNAFLSVKERHDKGIKGYQPKITVSTRVLPRFLQIRIKDNGIGMSDEILRKVQEEFFSTRPLEQGAGLGFSTASRVFTEPVKGELKIESEPGNSTDVYIKFYLI